MLNKAKLKVLILDDDVFMLQLLSHLLASQGFASVTPCDNGHQALNLFDSARTAPDLILLDLNMPEMDGVEFIRHLVKSNYTGSLILISGENSRVLQSAEKLVQAHRITILGHLRKPVKPAELTALIETWKIPAQDKPRRLNKSYSREEVRAAISNGELVNYYQPKVAVANGDVVGVETLARWRHPLDGMVFPDQFIPVAETDDLINDLTRAVMTGALAQSRAWRQAGLSLRVAINLSMDNLTSLDFADVVAELAAAAEVAPQDLILEVTESRLMTDMKVPLDILTRLSLKRFHLSIDDFGTGHSSLTQLSDIPFDELKVDRSFVHGADGNDTLRAIYDASLGLAKQLDMKVVAEGVEDRKDWAFLRRTGCDFAQGYFIGRPMPAEEIAGWIDQWEARREELAPPVK